MEGKCNLGGSYKHFLFFFLPFWPKPALGFHWVSYKGSLPSAAQTCLCGNQGRRSSGSFHLLHAHILTRNSLLGQPESLLLRERQIVDVKFPFTIWG